MQIGDTVRVVGESNTALVQEIWQNGNETWFTLDRDLGDRFRVSCEWPGRRLELRA